MIQPQKLSELLFNAVADGADLPGILDLAREEAFDNPIVLSNASFRVLALSSDVPVENDVPWNEAMTQGAFSEETIESFRYDAESSILLTERRLFLHSTGLGEKIPRILAPVDDRARPLGYLIVFGVKHPFRDIDFTYTEILCKALRILLRPSAALPDVYLSLEDYTLKQLLNREIDSFAQASSRVTKPYFTAISASVPEETKEKQYLPYLRELLTGAESYNHCFPYKGDLFLLLNFDSARERRQGLDALLKAADRFSLTAGVSNIFTDLTQLPVYYQQAVSARKTASSPDVVFFSDVVFEIVLNYIPSGDLEAMISGEYRILEAYDRIHNTELVKTVVAWYRHFLNIAETAAALHIHRNTVTYRLELVREKAGVPLDRIRTVQNIVLSDMITARL